MPILARAGTRRPGRADQPRPASVVALVAGLAVALAGCSSIPGPSGLRPSATTGAAASLPPPPCTPAAARASETVPWWHEAVFYEVFVRSFADTDADGIGDLDGVTAHLDDLNDGDAATSGDLGVTALWLMPIAAAASYHGYDVTDHSAVAPSYGDERAFEALIDGAHRRGIKVVLDFVPNHTSSRHPWFVDAAAGGQHRDWYIWSDHDPGWPGPVGGKPWHPSADGQWYYGAFSAEMPDLNLRNPATTAALVRIAEGWLDRGVDGFRIDAARHLIEDGPDDQTNTSETRAWLESFTDAVHARKPDAVVIGEVWDGRAVTSSYAADGTLDMPFDFGIGPTIASAVRLGDATSLLVAEEEIGRRYSPGVAGTFLTNHDQPRIMTELRGDVDAAKQAAAALFTAPGTPFIYYGEEIGLTGSKPDQQIRTPLPWTGSEPGHGFTAGRPWQPFAPGAAVANVEDEAADPASLLSTYRDLVHFRTSHPALSRGDFSRVSSSSREVAASLRSHGGETLLVLRNLASEPARGVTLNIAEGPLCGSPTAGAVYPAGAPTDPMPEVSAPEVTSAGGFAGYVPLAELPGRATIVVRLAN